MELTFDKLSKAEEASFGFAAVLMGKEFKGMISAAIADDGAKHGRSVDNARFGGAKTLRNGNNAGGKRAWKRSR